MGRRDFLIILAAAGVTAAGGYALFEYTPWLNYGQQADLIRKPFEKSSSVPAQMLELVRYATLAASSHNTQPWKFAIKDNAIEIHPDYTRRLTVIDPDGRELWICQGCALENLLVAARARGYTTEVTYPEAVDFIHVRLTAGAPLQSSPLFDAIPARQNTRSEYDGQPIRIPDLDQVRALSLEPGIVLHYVTNSADLKTALEYVNQGDLSSYGDKAFVEELLHWVRFTKKEALASLDGLYTLCSGNPEVPRWLGQIVVDYTKPQQEADADTKKLASSPGVVVVASASDGKTAWVRTGQVYERLALKMTSLNIKMAFLNQPIEVAALRSQFQSAMGFGSSLPQLLVRFGYANPMPFSLRRPVEQVLI
jgi:hypothetical protein